jgi:hypothetical protein
MQHGCSPPGSTCATAPEIKVFLLLFLQKKKNIFIAHNTRLHKRIVNLNDTSVRKLPGKH